jgi:hypothetical protein
MVGGLGEGFLWIVGYDEAPNGARESNVLGGPILLLQFGDVLVVNVASRAGHCETIAVASSSPQGRGGEAAQPYGRMGLLDRLGRQLDLVEIEEFALKGDGLSAQKPTNDFE